jgi:YidC/Oxa1 family membrane protein insertase
MDFLGNIIGYIMSLIYGIVSNYGFTIILISILMKLIMLPLTIKQQKSMAALNQIQPLITEVQQKYANDKEKQSTEMMKIYKEYNVQPFASCLPLLLQLPILFGLYSAIGRPLSFMLRLTAEQITKLGNLIGFEITSKMSAYSYEIAMAKTASMPEFVSKVQEAISNFNPIDFNFFGLDLSLTPSFSVVSIIWILPGLAALLTYLSSRIMQADTAKQDEMQSTQKTMNLLMPVMILMFGFQVPAGLSLYWTINSLLQIVQYYTLDKNFKKQLANEIAVKTASIESKKNKRG